MNNYLVTYGKPRFLGIVSLADDDYGSDIIEIRNPNADGRLTPSSGSGHASIAELRNRQMNPDAGYILKIAISIIPVGVVGFFFREQVEALFGTSVPFVGVMLWVTAGLLLLTHFVKPKKQRPVGYGDALVIGLAQALAVVPGISRSGATIATGMLLGNDRTQLAKFSFLMVLVPVLGEALLELIGGEFSAAAGNGASWSVLIAGFLAAYVAGLFACRVMIRLVSRGKLYWFAIYCVLMGTVAVIWG